MQALSCPFLPCEAAQFRQYGNRIRISFQPQYHEHGAEEKGGDGVCVSGDMNAG